MSHTINHLSWSSLSTYMQCSLKWKYHYVDRLEQEFTPSALHFGKAIHSAIATFLQSNLNSEIMSLDDLMEEYNQAWRNHDGPPIKFGAKECKESLYSTAEGLLNLFQERFSTETKVLAIEEPFELTLLKVEPDHIFELPVLAGIVDAIIQQGDSMCLVDYKTASRRPYGDVNSMQLTAYSLGVQALGFNPDKLDYRYDYLVKTKEPAIVQHPVTITELERQRFVKITERVWRSIRQAIFFPNPSFYCSGCVYQSKCKDW